MIKHICIDEQYQVLISLFTFLHFPKTSRQCIYQTFPTSLLTSKKKKIFFLILGERDPLITLQHIRLRMSQQEKIRRFCASFWVCTVPNTGSLGAAYFWTTSGFNSKWPLTLTFYWEERNTRHTAKWISVSTAGPSQWRISKDGAVVVKGNALHGSHPRSHKQKHHLYRPKKAC